MQDDNPLVFPKQIDKDRLEKYKHYDELYEGEHFEAFSVKIPGEFSTQYKKLRYLTANFAGLMSRVIADMLFGESLTIDLKDKKAQSFVDGLIHQNDLINQLYESSIINSRRGFDVFKIRIGKRNPLNPEAKAEIIIEQVGAQIYYPQFDNKAARNVTTQDIIATTFNQNGKTYLHKETHQPGQIVHEVFQYDPKQGKIITAEMPEDFGFLPIEKTLVNRSLIFAIPNYRDGKFWGPSDYKDLESLFFALNNRLTKTDNILDKHSDPILAVPPGVIDEEGKVKKESLGMFEVDNENPGFNKPEYIVWNANLESAFTEIEKLIEMLFMFSEIAPATMGADKNGQAESGRALKFKLLATIRKRNRKISYYDLAIKEMLQTAQELAIAWKIDIEGVRPTKAERPTIKWGDGVINDETEQVENATARIDAGLSSRADEIARLDDITPEEAQKKVKEIDAESGPTLPPIPNDTPPVDPNNPTPPGA
jgi:hypothetical protein